MPYKTEYGINLSVENGPPAVKQSDQLERVDSTSGQRYSFTADSFLNADGSEKPYVDTAVAAPAGALRFLSINANHFVYDECGKKTSGVSLIINNDAADPPAVMQPQIYLDRPGQDLNNFKQFSFRVKKELLTAAPEIVLTITYGIDEPDLSAN